jgi:hypothetical protein
MSNNESLFTEFELKTKNEKIWKLIPYCCLFYIIIFSIDYLVIFPRFMRGFLLDWDRYLGILIFPVAGIILLLFKSNYAWFVNIFFYMLSAMFLSIDFFIEVFIYKLKLNEYRSFIAIVLLILSVINLVLLQTKSVREYFKISLSTFRISLISFIIISIAIITAIYNS